MNRPGTLTPFPGGIHPPENKAQSTTTAIAQVPLAPTYILPLNQHSGTPARALVKPGDQVLKGQLLARAGGFVSAPIHAPTSGTVQAIRSHRVPHPSGLSEDCIILHSDGLDRWCECQRTPEYWQLDSEQLVARIHDSGVVGLGGAGFPAAVKMASRQAGRIHTLIVNGAECEPYITADDLLMRERAEQIVSGIAILRHLLKLEQVLIGIEDNKPEAIAAMTAACANDSDCHVISVPTRYPSGDAQRLIYLLTGREVPHNARSVDIGLLCYNVGTLAAIHDAVIEGRPLISRITTVTGQALARPGNLEALIGTPIDHLLAFAGLHRERLYNLVLGGPMMGFSLADTQVPVIKTSNCLIAATAEEMPPPPPAQPCIRCNICAQACPCSLLPQQLFWHARAENYDQLSHHNLFDCIECGACSYVCPSRIPLVQYFRAAKDSIRQQQAQRAKSERSRQRFEARQQRQALEQAEKEARRRANAERAARMKSDAALGGEDPIKAALARAKARKATTGSSTMALSQALGQLKKAQDALARAKASGQSDLDRLQGHIRLLQAQVAQLQPQDTPQAQLEKAQLAYARALEKGSADSEALKDTVADCHRQLEQLAPAQEETVKTTANAPNSDLRVLKINNALAQARLKKLRRALEQGQADNQEPLRVELEQAQQQAAQAEQALHQHLNRHDGQHS